MNGICQAGKYCTGVTAILVFISGLFLHKTLIQISIMKKVTVAKAKSPTPKPELEWQTGEYSRDAEFKFLLPYQFLLLCKLMDVPPEDMVQDFMDNLSCGSWKRAGRDEAKEHLVNYFVSHGYGKQYYSEDDIRQMFKEMDALGLLFPVNGSGKLLDSYSDWRSEHHDFWFNKWFHQPGRKSAEMTEP